MKKTVFFILSVFMVIAVQAGQVARPSLSGSISERVAQRANRQASTLKSSADFVPQTSTQQRQKAITQALRKVTSQPTRTITWGQFLQEAEATTKDFSLYEKNSTEAFNEFLHIKGAEDAVVASYTVNQGHPDYVRETKGAKYIYIGEAAHKSEQYINHSLLLLQEIRRAKPGAHILLASEFAVRTSQFSSPICFAMGECSIASISNEYYTLHQEVATTLQIDILALDNAFVNALWPQIGDTNVSYDIDDPSFQEALAAYEQIDPSYAPYDVADSAINASWWGVQKRNEQWARYISAISPYYDVIVIYAGIGHIVSKFGGINPLLQKPCIKIYTIPLELSEAGAVELQRMEERDDFLRNQGSYYEPGNIIAENVTLNSFEKAMQKAEGRVDSSKPFYIKVTDVSDPVLFKKYTDLYRARTGIEYENCGDAFVVYL